MPLDPKQIDQIKSLFSGRILLQGDAGYDEARRVHNGMIDKKPAIIAQCLGTADVREAVQFAATNNLVIAVRGGGHNVAGRAVCDDGLMIDLSQPLSEETAVLRDSTLSS